MPKDHEMKFGKIEVAEPFREHGIGTILMEMVISIAKFYEAPRITGTIQDGEKFRWYWFARLGFTIYEQRRLLIELSCHS